MLHIRGGCLGKNYKINFITIARAYTYDTEFIPIFSFYVLAVLASGFRKNSKSVAGFCFFKYAFSLNLKKTFVTFKHKIQFFLCFMIFFV